MSRSYKKTWGWTDHHRRTTKLFKRFANKKVRGIENIMNGSSYKKYFQSYTICDYKFLYFYRAKSQYLCTPIYKNYIK